MYSTAQSLLGTHIAHSLYICSVPSVERTNVQLRFLLVKITMEFLQCISAYGLGEIKWFVRRV